MNKNRKFRTHIHTYLLGVTRDGRLDTDSVEKEKSEEKDRERGKDVMERSPKIE